MPTWIRVPGMFGSILFRGSTRVCGIVTVWSWNGPLMRMFATSTPMNDIISVVMISFVPYFAFSSAGMIVQIAPAAPAMRNRSVSASASGSRSTSEGPQPETKAAPSRNCPS